MRLICLVVAFVTLNSAAAFAAKKPPKKPLATYQKPPQMVADGKNHVKKIAEDDKGILSVVLENDLFNGSDGGYTSGIRFSYTTSEQNMPLFVRQASSYLPLLNGEGKKRLTVALGQTMFTPSDINNPDFIPNDFIYAGWLYGSLGIISDSGSKFDNVILTLGTVGPASQAENTQKIMHKMLGVTNPKGWHHQLKDEPGLILTYERRWREIYAARVFDFGFDVMPAVGVNLGNILTNAMVGTTFRLGNDLPADYGPPRIGPTLSGSDFFIPSKRFSGYLFSTFELKAVARNIFLDGNTFKDSHSLDKKTMVGSVQLGGTLIYNEMRVSYTHSISSKQFKGQPGSNEQFGGITVSYRF